MKKYLIPALLSIAFVILLMSLSPNIPLQNQPTTPTLPATVPAKAVETPWQTYRNEKYGFEFQHPYSSINVQETPSTYLQTIKYYNSAKYPKTCTPENTAGGGFCEIYNLVHEDQFIVDKTKIYFFIVDGNEPNIGYLYLTYKNKNYLIQLGLYTKPDISKIISTFKFLPDTTTWKTYKNTQYGFEFQYPANWDILDKLNDSENKFVIAGSMESIQNEKKYGGKDRGSNYFPFFVSYSSIKPKYLSSGEEEVVSSEILFNGKGATKYVRKVLVNNPSGGNEGEILTSIIVPLSQGYLNIYQSNNYQSPGAFDQILSTFKFTK